MCVNWLIPAAKEGGGRVIEANGPCAGKLLWKGAYIQRGCNSRAVQYYLSPVIYLESTPAPYKTNLLTIKTHMHLPEPSICHHPSLGREWTSLVLQYQASFPDQIDVVSMDSLSQEVLPFHWSEPRPSQWYITKNRKQQQPKCSTSFLPCKALRTMSRAGSQASLKNSTDSVNSLPTSSIALWNRTYMNEYHAALNRMYI